MANKKWNYTISTGTIWTSFDFGTVEAETQELALEKANQELKKNFGLANRILQANEATDGFSLEFAADQITITEVKQK